MQTGLCLTISYNSSYNRIPPFIAVMQLSLLNINVSQTENVLLGTFYIIYHLSPVFLVGAGAYTSS